MTQENRQHVARRSVIKGLGTAFIAAGCGFRGTVAMAQVLSKETGPWTEAWNHAALVGTLERAEPNYDAAVHMIRAHRGPEYNYQSNLRSTVVHPIRDAFEYALMLMELNSPENDQRALQVLEATLSLQEKDEKSKWFGLWSYYREEPLAQMATVDFNWADFNGSLLLLILFRHGARVPGALKMTIMGSIARACESIRRRDVSVYYTNIIAQGSFVVLAYSQLSGDRKWLEYGRDRLRRWAAVVDDSGSFAEFNSSAYTSFVIEIMTRIDNYVTDDFSLALSRKLEHRVWDHFSAHWHAPTMQLAGPMSRCYHNDIGSPLWLQKSLDNRLVFSTLEEVQKEGGSVPAALLRYRCPAEFRARFITPSAPHVHREIFISGHDLIDTLVPLQHDARLEPVQGTTMLTPKFALGTANRSDFWVQRRPLLAYWGGRQRPPHVMQMRVIKDDYDFSSALLHSVQEQGSVLGVVGFRQDGGDKHPLIDRIKDGQFSMRSMKMELQFSNWQDGWKVLIDGSPARSGSALNVNSRFAVDTGACRIGFQVRWAEFRLAASEGKPYKPTLAWIPEGDKATIRLTLYDAGAAREVRWKDVGRAVCAFTMEMSDAAQTLRQFDDALAKKAFALKQSEQGISVTSGIPQLGVSVRSHVGTYAEMESSFHSSIGGKPVPYVRLREEKLLG